MDEQSHLITGLETQKRNIKRVNVFVNDTFAFSLSLEEAAKLHKGQVLTDADMARLRDGDEVGRAVDRALRFMAVRPRSEHEVRRSLLDKDVPQPAVDLAIERLHALGYLDDHAFAGFWVNDRRQFKPLSTRALRYELRQKGIASDIIDEVLQEQDDSDEAYRAAQAQLRRVRSTDRADLRQKLMMFLARRGFASRESREAVSRLLDELDAEGLLPPDLAEDFSEDEL